MATNNDFVTLAVPASAGVGVPSDISDMAFGPSIIVDGPDSSTGEVIIEVSEDGTNFAPATTVFPIHNPIARILDVVAKFARVRRFSGTGPANVALGSVKTTNNSFVALTSTIVPADTSEMGPLRTVVVVGQYDTPISIMGSNDGTNYDVIASFNNLSSDVLSFVGAYAFTRLRCDSPLSNASVAIGGGFVAAPSGGAGGVTSVNTETGAVVIVGDSGVTVTESGGQIHVGQQLIADWDPTVMRVYAIDLLDGDDADDGFATPTSPSQPDYQIACVAAGAVAKKTFAGLAAIFPKNGNGRMVEIVIANGGTNTEGVYAEDIAIFLSSCFGYAGGCPLVRGTGTNPNAACTKFDGTLNDVTYEGGITVPGLNVAGYNPGPFNTSDFIFSATKVGGGSPAFPAEPAAPLGWRIRFDANTATVLLRGASRQISQVLSVDSVALESALLDSPTAADVFYVEQAGVLWTQLSLLGGTGLGNPSAQSQPTFRLNNPAQISGLRNSGGIKLSECCFRFIFAGSEAIGVAPGYGALVTSQDLLHPVYGVVTVGGGLRVESSFLSSGGPGEIFAEGLVLGAPGNVSSIELDGFSKMSFGKGSFASQLNITDHYGISQDEPLGQLATPPDIGGSTGGGFFTRVNFLTIDGSRVLISGLSIENSTVIFPRACIRLSGQCQLFLGGNVTGSTGNDDVGLDLLQSLNSLIIMTALPTVTGALGDVRLSTGEIVPWSEVFNNGFVDANGNRFIGSLRASGGGSALGYIPFTGSIQGNVGATQSYLADSGFIGAVNQTTPFNRPTSLRFITRLRVSVVGNTSVNAVTVTLIKNGVPTGMLVTIPAGSVAPQSDLTDRVLLLDTDTFDLRLDDPAGDPGGVVSVSAALEWSL